jgi:hypothetical protein
VKGSHKNLALLNKIKKIDDPKLLKIYDKKQYLNPKEEQENTHEHEKDKTDNS